MRFSRSYKLTSFSMCREWLKEEEIVSFVTKSLKCRQLSVIKRLSELAFCPLRLSDGLGQDEGRGAGRGQEGGGGGDGGRAESQAGGQAVKDFNHMS